jgi:hypothetical protein
MNYKKISTKREQEIAKDISGRRHPGSGNTWSKKGDSSNEFILVEDKYVVGDKYSINLRVINKLTKEANKQAKIPILRFGFTNKEAVKDYACIETIYCNSLSANEEYLSTAKSKIFYYDDLYITFVLSYGSPVIAKLIFEKEERSFYIIEWEDFLYFQEKIIVSS